MTLPAENTLKEADVNSVIIGNIEDGKIHSFDDSFSIRIEEAQETDQGVQLPFRVFNRDNVNYKQLSLKFQAAIRKDDDCRVESKTVSLPDVIEASGQKMGAVSFSQADAVKNISSLKVFIGE